MPRERKPPLTLRERAQQWVYDAQQREIIDPVTHADAFIAGWHARGRAERVTKAVVDAAIAHVQDRSGGSECYLINAVANLERAKGRK